MASAAAVTEIPQAELDAIERAKNKKYMNVFWALCLFTVCEVGVVFLEKHLSKLIIDSIVILFTLLKAGFVGYYFMHLEYEKTWTKIVAVLPLLLIGAYAVVLTPDTKTDRPISLYIPEPARVLPAGGEKQGPTGAPVVGGAVEGEFFQVIGSESGGVASDLSAGAEAPAAGAGASAVGSPGAADSGAPASGNPLDSVEAWR